VCGGTSAKVGSVGRLRCDFQRNIAKKQVFYSDTCKLLRNGYIHLFGSIEKVWVSVGSCVGKVGRLIGDFEGNLTNNGVYCSVTSKSLMKWKINIFSVYSQTVGVWGYVGQSG
jgi:hypothetical protein